MPRRSPRYSWICDARDGSNSIGGRSRLSLPPLEAFRQCGGRRRAQGYPLVCDGIYLCDRLAHLAKRSVERAQRRQHALRQALAKIEMLRRSGRIRHREVGRRWFAAPTGQVRTYGRPGPPAASVSPRYVCAAGRVRVGASRTLRREGILRKAKLALQLFLRRAFRCSISLDLVCVLIF